MKTIKLTTNKRVRIGNAAVTSNNLKQALDFSKKASNKPKFLKVAITLCPGAIVLSWSVKNVGFGEVTYFLEKGKIKIDSELMSEEFIQDLHKEILKQYKKKKLSIQFSENLFPALLEKLLSEIQFNK